MKKKILITGSQGYIAKNIAKKLQNKNIIVHGIGRGEWKKKDYFEWGYKNQINGNINLKNLSKFNTKFDYIIHCAGSGTVGLSNNIDFKNNVESTKLLLEYVKKNQDNVKIIFLSSYSVYGNNYNTKDGTCIRDYIHISDLSKIHLKLLNLISKKNKSYTINCGYGIGYSVFDIIKNFEKELKIKVKINILPKRPGDVSEIFSSNQKLKKLIKINEKNKLKKIILSSVEWERYLLKH